MPTPLGIQGTAANSAQSAIKQVERMSQEQALKILTQLNTQIQGSDGSIKSGVLSLVNLDRPDADVRFERKSWYQFKARSAERMETTARVIEALIDKAGTANLQQRRELTNYLERRSDRVGTQTLQRVLSRMDLNPEQPIQPNTLLNEGTLDAFRRSQDHGSLVPSSPEDLKAAVRGVQAGNYEPVLRLFQEKEAYGSQGPLSEQLVSKLAMALFGKTPQPAALARFVMQAHELNNIPSIDDIDDSIDLNQETDGVDPKGLAKLAVYVGLETYGRSEAAFPKLADFTQQLHLQLSQNHPPRMNVLLQKELSAVVTGKNSVISNKISNESLRGDLLRIFNESSQPLKEGGPVISNLASVHAGGIRVLDTPNLNHHKLHDEHSLSVKGGSLNGAYLSKGLRDANFNQADLKGLDTSAGIEMDRVQFIQCDLTGVRLRLGLEYPMSLLSQVSFRGSDLSNAQISIDYSKLNYFPPDSPPGTHASVFNHLGKEHASSPLTMIDSIPNRFMGLKNQLMREAIEHMVEYRLVDKLQAPLCDILRGNLGYMEDPYIREKLGPMLLADPKLAPADRAQLSHKMLLELNAMPMHDKHAYISKNSVTVNLMLAQEFMEPPVVPSDSAKGLQRRELAQAATAIESIVHQSSEYLTQPLAAAYMFDSEEFKPEVFQAMENGKRDHLLLFPVDGELAFVMTYGEFSKLLTAPDEEAFSKILPLRNDADGWKMGVASSPDRLRALRKVPLLAQRYDDLKPTPAFEALRLALESSPALQNYIVPGLKGVGSGKPPAEINFAVQPNIDALYRDIDQIVSTDLNARNNSNSKVIQTWEKPMLDPSYLEKLKAVAATDAIDVQNPRQWALYLLNIAITVGRVGSNAALGTHVESVNSLRFHAYKLMEAARKAEPNLFNEQTWDSWGKDFQAVNMCAEVLTARMLTESKNLDPAMFERVVPAHFRQVA